MLLNSFELYVAISPSNKYYVGITSQGFEVRKAQHIARSKYENTHRPFCKAIRKYGNSIDWVVLASNLTKKEAQALEIEYIINLKAIGHVYNVTPGGELPWNTGTVGVCPRSPESIVKQQISRAGYTHSAETRSKISSSNTGRIVSKEQLCKYINTRNIKKVEMYNLDGSFVELIHNRSEAVRKYNISSKGILACLKGQAPSHKGYKFKYQNEEFSVYVDKRTLDNPSRRLNQARARTSYILLLDSKETSLEFLSLHEFAHFFGITKKVARTKVKNGQFMEFSIVKIDSPINLGETYDR